jgi:hypothetical protein
MTVLSSSNFPVLYKDATSIIEAFYKWRLVYYKRRKEHYMKVYQERLDEFRDKQKIVNLIVTKKVNVFNREEEEILADFKSKGVVTPEQYTRLTMNQLTAKSLEKMKETDAQYVKELEYYKKNSAKDLWKEDLRVFKEVYKLRYKI